MDPITIELGNGKQLFSLQTDRFKNEVLGVSFLMPATPAEYWENALILSLSQHGTVSYPTRSALVKYTDELYSTTIRFQTDRFGDMQILGVSADFLGEKYVNDKGGLLPKIVQLLADVLLNPFMCGGEYPQETVALTKKLMTDQVRSVLVNPRATAVGRCKELLCEGEPCAEPLTAATEYISAADSPLLSERFRRIKEGLCPRFYYVGNTPAGQVAELLQKAFVLSGVAPVEYHTKTASVCSAPKIETTQMPVGQSRLAVGFRGDISLSHPDAPAVQMMNEIFGGSPASKLFLHVREEKAICYQCVSSVDLHKGILVADAGIAAENRGLAEDSIMAQFEEIRKGNITQSEFSAAKKALDYSYRQMYDSPVSLAGFYTRRAFLGIPENVEEWRRRLRAVRIEDVVNAAKLFGHGATVFVKGIKCGEEAAE